MGNQLLITMIAGTGYLAGAVGSYVQIRHGARWAAGLVRVAVLIALAANVGYLGRSIMQWGVVRTFQENFEAILLLSALIGLVGLGTHLSKTLRGLDGLLFLVAGIIEFTELLVIRQPEAVISGRPWFISHSLAFALSAACFVAGGVAGVAYLLVHTMLRRKRLSLVRRVPPLEALERFGRWMPIIGFPLFTFGILTGLCGVQHRKDIVTQAWFLDPSFLFSLAAWVVYAYLSVSIMYRSQLRGRRAAVWSTYGLGLVVVAFLAREFLSPMLHR